MAFYFILDKLPDIFLHFLTLLIRAPSHLLQPSQRQNLFFVLLFISSHILEHTAKQAMFYYLHYGQSSAESPWRILFVFVCVSMCIPAIGYGGKYSSLISYPVGWWYAEIKVKQVRGIVNAGRDIAVFNKGTESVSLKSWWVLISLPKWNMCLPWLFPSSLCFKNSCYSYTP